MLCQRGRACQACAASKRRCSGERPCKRCVALTGSIAEAEAVCVELPDRRTKSFVAMRKRADDFHECGGETSGVKRRRGGACDEPHVSYRGDATVTSHRLGLPGIEPQAKTAAKLPASGAPATAAELAGFASVCAGERRQYPGLISGDDGEAAYAAGLMSPGKRLRGMPAPDATGTSATPSHPAPALKRMPTQLETSSGSACTSPHSVAVAVAGDGVAPLKTTPAEPEDVVESLIHDNIRASAVPTARFRFDVTTGAVRSAVTNTAWRSLFAVTAVNAVACAGDMSRFVHPDDAPAYVAASRRMLALKAAAGVASAKFVGAAGAVFQAREVLQFDYSGTGLLRAVTMYYTDIQRAIAPLSAPVVAPVTHSFAVGRNSLGGISMAVPPSAATAPAAMGAAAPLPHLRPIPRPVVPLDAQLEANIQATMKKLQDDAWLARINAQFPPSPPPSPPPAPTRNVSAFGGLADGEFAPVVKQPAVTQARAEFASMPLVGGDPVGDGDAGMSNLLEDLFAAGGAVTGVKQALPPFCRAAGSPFFSSSAMWGLD